MPEIVCHVINCNACVKYRCTRGAIKIIPSITTTSGVCDSASVVFAEPKMSTVDLQPAEAVPGLDKNGKQPS